MKNHKGHVHGSLENENGGFEERLKMMERLVFPMQTPTTQNYETAIMSYKITKMLLWASNVDPLTLLTWK